MDHIAGTRELISLALNEDIGTGDLTALAVPPDVRTHAYLVAKEDCVLSGLELAPLTLEVFGADAEYKLNHSDGTFVKKGTTVLECMGKARDLLTTERTLLNMLQRTCGIATQARRFKEALGESELKILDTRKTTPGFRYWEKKAVKDGGLYNHRLRLDEAVLLKENHIRASGSIKLALANLQGKVPANTSIEVEVTNWEEAKEAMDCSVTRLLLDNFSAAQAKELATKIRAYKPGMYLEGSGGITLETVRSYSGIGLDAVSAGALTHSVKAADLSFLFQAQ
jgi:nicotinate-nucleotide pyrophosphorylase (carboxylating)